MATENQKENKQLIMRRLVDGVKLGTKRGADEVSRAFDELESIARDNAYLEVFETLAQKADECFVDDDKQVLVFVNKKRLLEWIYDIRVDFEV